MNTYRLKVDRSGYAKLAYAALGLILATVLLRGVAAVGGSAASVLAIDLLTLAMGALLGWLGGGFTAPREAPAPLLRSWHPGARGAIAQKAA